MSISSKTLLQLIKMSSRQEATLSFSRSSRSWASEDRRLSFLACNLLWPCFLIEASDRVKWESLIAKSFIFEVST